MQEKVNELLNALYRIEGIADDHINCDGPWDEVLGIISTVTTNLPPKVSLPITSKELSVLFLIDEMEELQYKLRSMREDLVHSGTCTHSKTTPNIWEHDTGYGKQREILGKRCKACGLVDYFSDGRWLEI